jgi:hypothetical protein
MKVSKGTEVLLAGFVARCTDSDGNEKSPAVVRRNARSELPLMRKAIHWENGPKIPAKLKCLEDAIGFLELLSQG